LSYVGIRGFGVLGFWGFGVLGFQEFGVWEKQKKLMQTKKILGRSVSRLFADKSRWASKAFFSTSKFAFASDIPSDAERKELNLFMSINNAMDIAMETDPTATLFGEDVKFGGVFRCSLG
jgi:hypothetical protein